MVESVKQESFPRIALKCTCGNEFVVNVIRMRTEEVSCQVCGQKFPEDQAQAFAKALEDLYLVRHKLEKEGFPFHFSFKYKSTYSQPPLPFSFDEE